MSVFTRHSRWFVLILLCILAVVATVVYADTVENDVVVSGNVAIPVGGSATVKYWIQAVNAGGANGDGQQGCNAADGSSATVTILAPTGVTATPSSLTFSACGNNANSATAQSVVFSSNMAGAYTIPVSVTDTGSTPTTGTYNVNNADFTLYVDSTPPIITPVVNGTPGTNGWYTSNVTVTWTVSDPESPVTSPACTTGSVTTDTTGTTFTCSATSAGGTSSQSVTIKRDATAPTINGSAAPNAVWTNQDVTVSFVCNDAVSGLASCTLPTTLTSEGANQSVLGTAVDNAGNSATFNVGGINIDKTAPIVSAAAAPLANAAGWNNTNVTVSFTCSDGLSGLAGACPSAVTLTGEGAGQSAGSGLVSDLAGNTASASVSNINIDKTAPTISGLAAPLPNAAGWNNTPVTVSFDCGDSLSGVASCSTDTVLSSDGIDQSVMGTAIDAAGNTATATVGNIDIDQTAPFITGSRTPSANANGWNNTDVTVSFLCADGGGSPVVSCSSPQIFGEGLAQSATGYVMDEAGNTNSATVSNINVDKTAPTISGAATTSPNAHDWYNTDVVLQFTCADALSTVDETTCQDVTVSSEGMNQGGTGSVSDLAGNTATASVAGLNIDKTNPTITPNVSGTVGTNGWYVSAVTVSYTCDDALSGVDTCNENQNFGEGAGQNASGTVTDKAGNSASTDTLVLNIDLTAPVITGSRTPDANAYGWNNDDVIVSFECVDALSGIVECPDPTTVTTEGENQSVGSGLVYDNAGNSSSDTVENISIDKTDPTITPVITGTAGTNGWYISAVTVSYTCDDALSGVDTCSENQNFGEGAGQNASGTVTDKAGNSTSTDTLVLNIDLTAPTVTGSRTPDANEHGWNNDDVTVSFECVDALSGIVECPDPTTVTTEGENQSVGSGLVYDNAGNSSSDTVENISIDKTNPTITRNVSGTAGTNGWYVSAVTVSYTCDDALSGVDTCSDNQNFGEGAGQNASGTVTDKAGNSASTDTLVLNIDLTAPTVTGSRTPDANAYGWNNDDVIVSFECVDTLSGIVECPTDTVVSSEGENQSVDSGLVYDNAGNSSSDTVENISIDKSAPVVIGSREPGANANGWNNEDVTVTFTCNDAVSDIVACPPPTVVSAEGDNLSVDSGPVYDLAGNSSSDVVTGIKIDKTAPVVTGSRLPLANSDGWNNGAVTVSFTCSDGGSGIVACPGSTTLSGEGAGQSVYSGLVYDLADNSSDATVSDINIDLTNPAITAAASPVANGFGWNNSNVTVTFTCNDALSGIKTCSSPVTLSGEGAAQSASGTATDEAGNSAGATASNINIDKTAPVVTVTGVSNGAVYILGTVPVASCTTSDALSGVNVSATISTQETDGLINGVGSFTATCSGASDKAGNAGSASVNYTVTYNFSGFTAPVDNPPVVNTVRAGSAIPIKFSLGGNYGLNILQGNATVVRINCSTSAPSDAIETTVTAGNSSLSYDATTGLYTYVWKTARNLSGCYQFTLNLADGTQRVAIFNFR